MKSPYEYRALSYGKAVNALAGRIIELSGREAFVGGKPVPDFWRLRAALTKIERDKLNVLYDYLHTLEHSIDSLGKLFAQADRYRQDQALSKTDIEPYKTISIADILGG